MITLTLPYPISLNRYQRNQVVRKAGRGEFVIPFPTKEAKAYKAEVKRIALALGVRPILGPVEYEFELYPHLPLDWRKRAKLDPVWWDLTVQCLDLDNARKVLLDALNGIAWTDDSRIRRDPGEIMVPDGDARCVIRIKPFERKHPQEALFSDAPLIAHPPRKAIFAEEKPF